MTQVEGNIDLNGECIGLNISVGESLDEPTAPEGVAINGIKNDSEYDQCGLKGEAVQQTFVDTLEDSSPKPDATIQDMSRTVKKSSMERLPDEPTAPDEVALNGIKNDSEYEQCGLKEEVVHQTLVDNSPKLDASLPDMSRRVRKSSMERLLEEKLNTCDTDGDVFLDRNSCSPPSSRASISSSASMDDDGAPRLRRPSVYEQKQIEAPSSTRGNAIATRTENLLKQYVKDSSFDMGSKPMIDLTEGGDVPQVNDDGTERTSVEVNTDSPDRVLDVQSAKLQYQQKLAEEDGEKSDENSRSIDETEASRKSLGSQMNRYIARAKGESISHSDEDEHDGGEDNSLYVDEHGGKIERSGGKIEIVKSSDSISCIKDRFDANSRWKKDAEMPPSNDIDSSKVNSIRSMVKQREAMKQDNSIRNRPVLKKVKDPKELMELRKKATYGDVVVPQDGVVKRSVVIEQDEVDNSKKLNAINIYKNLELKAHATYSLHKPRTKLISDTEAQATMEGMRSLSSSTSEASDLNETTNDLTVDTVSGYGSAAPCSPSSTLSEDYLSDHKDASPREELKDPSVILHCDEESTLNLEAKSELNNLDDITLLNCHAEISSGDVEVGHM